MRLHQSQDMHTQEAPSQAKQHARIEALRKEAARTREFVACSAPRTNAKGQELKTNITDPESAKMATSKGVVQGYAAQAAVDSAHQVIVAADVIGSGSEQSMLLPMIAQAGIYRAPHTLVTADAGCHSDANMAALMRKNIPALIADNQMRQRDERFEEQGKHKAKGEVLYDKQPTGPGKPVKRFRPRDFAFNDDDNTATCPAGATLTSNGSRYSSATGQQYRLYVAQAEDCQGCALRQQCLKDPNRARGRQVTRFERKEKDDNHPSERMRRAIDSDHGRRLYSQRLGTVEPVFANLRHNKRLDRLTMRGRCKVNAQWHLYCMVHNIEKLANSGWRA